VEILSSRIIVRPADVERSMSFYRDDLGLAICREYPGGTVFFAGQGFLEVAAHGGTGAPTVFDGALWLQVRDVHGCAAELEGKGVTIDKAPELQPWGLIEMWLTDPDGMPIVLVEVPESHPLRQDTRRQPGV
jgi:predicted enzyme related to lactoylglutathione lyase